MKCIGVGLEYQLKLMSAPYPLNQWTDSYQIFYNAANVNDF